MGTPNKDQLIADLRMSFQDTVNWINAEPESQFNEIVVPGKWTIAGHLYHLIKSTKGVSNGMALPKKDLKENFGSNNRRERTYLEMTKKYTDIITNKNFKTLSTFEAEPGRQFERAALVQRFEHELTEFENALSVWSEDEMSDYVMPHPALGKLTIREFTYFTILHTYHHLKSLREKYSVRA